MKNYRYEQAYFSGYRKKGLQSLALIDPPLPFGSQILPNGTFHLNRSRISL